LKIFKPEIFQGSLNKNSYFEGWYFKHVSTDQKQVYAFIPGISLTKDDSHAFIQIINGLTGETHYIDYSIDQFRWSKNELNIQIGDSIFNESSIDLNINSKNITVNGRLEYSELSKYSKTLLSPGIMGWYSYVPFMECYHGVVSANHIISGSLNINSVASDFTNGKGYIEKDWGTSFPECWIWVQSNSFSTKTASVFVSIAKIPWRGKFFMGFIAFLYLNGKYYKFATYNNSKIVDVNLKGNKLKIDLKNHKYQLSVLIKTNNAGDLIAPVRGNMTRRIKESIDSEVNVILTNKKGEVIFKDYSKTSGLEIVDKIFDYL
jgi:tocopherol cyclase